MIAGTMMASPGHNPMLRAVISNPPVPAATAIVRTETWPGSTSLRPSRFLGGRAERKPDDVQHHTQPAGERQQQKGDPYDVSVHSIAPGDAPADTQQHAICRRTSELHTAFDAVRGRRAVHAHIVPSNGDTKHQVPTLNRTHRSQGSTRVIPDGARGATAVPCST